MVESQHACACPAIAVGNRTLPGAPVARRRQIESEASAYRYRAQKASTC